MEENYNLVAQKVLGDFEVVDINRLGNNINVSGRLSDIDRFTSQYTLEDLTNLIASSNMIGKDYLAGNLRVINNNKQNHSIITKEVINNIQEFKNSKDIIYVNTKDILRGKFNDDLDKKINGIELQKYVKKLQSITNEYFMTHINKIQNENELKSFLKGLFNEFLKQNNRVGICLMLKFLPYEMSRKLMFVINHDIIMREKTDTTRNLRKGNEL